MLNINFSYKGLSYIISFMPCYYITLRETEQVCRLLHIELHLQNKRPISNHSPGSVTHYERIFVVV